MIRMMNYQHPSKKLAECRKAKMKKEDYPGEGMLGLKAQEYLQYFALKGKCPNVTANPDTTDRVSSCSCMKVFLPANGGDIPECDPEPLTFATAQFMVDFINMKPGEQRKQVMDWVRYSERMYVTWCRMLTKKSFPTR